MRFRTIVLMVALVSVAALAMAFEPSVDEPPLSLWIQAKCKVLPSDVAFSWNPEGFIVAYGRTPTVSCAYTILDRHARDNGAVDYTLVAKSNYCNRFFIVTINEAEGCIHEMCCMTVRPDSTAPSGDFAETWYVF